MVIPGPAPGHGKWAAPAVGDGGRAQLDRCALGRAEILVSVRVRLDDDNLALGADCRHHVDIQRLLAAPVRVGGRVVRLLPGLVNLPEAPVSGCAGRELVLLPVRCQIALQVRRIVGIDDRYRLIGVGVSGGFGEVICRLERVRPVWRLHDSADTGGGEPALCREDEGIASAVVRPRCGAQALYPLGQADRRTGMPRSPSRRGTGWARW